jgi:hypothetical protein
MAELEGGGSDRRAAVEDHRRVGTGGHHEDRVRMESVGSRATRLVERASGRAVDPRKRQ